MIISSTRIWLTDSSSSRMPWSTGGDPPVVCPNHPCSYDRLCGQSPGIWLRREHRHRRQPTTYQWGAGRSHPPPSRQPRPSPPLRSSALDLALFPCTSGAVGIQMAHAWRLPRKTAATRPCARNKVRGKKTHHRHFLLIRLVYDETWAGKTNGVIDLAERKRSELSGATEKII